MYFSALNGSVKQRSDRYSERKRYKETHLHLGMLTVDPEGFELGDQGFDILLDFDKYGALFGWRVASSSTASADGCAGNTGRCWSCCGCC